MPEQALPFPDDLVQFVAAVRWTFARTMPEWPHEYIVRQRVDGLMFDRLAGHIRGNGFEGRFYEQRNVYFRDGDLRYWVIGSVINRCLEYDSYDARLARGGLPGPRKT